MRYIFTLFLLIVSFSSYASEETLKRSVETEILSKSGWVNVILQDENFDWSAVDKLKNTSIDLTRKVAKLTYLDLSGADKLSSIKFSEGVGVIFAKSDIEKGATLGKENTEIRVIPRYKITKYHVKSYDDLGDKITARRIMSDRPIVMTDITRDFLVYKGDLVNVIYTDTNLVLEYQAIALEDGAYQEQIKIKTIDNGRFLYATVIGEDKVIIN